MHVRLGARLGKIAHKRSPSASKHVRLTHEEHCLAACLGGFLAVHIEIRACVLTASACAPPRLVAARLLVECDVARLEHRVTKARVTRTDAHASRILVDCDVMLRDRRVARSSVRSVLTTVWS